MASLQSLPDELIEAAEVDGASQLQVMRYVYLPHLKPAIIVMVLMSTFWTFNNFVYVWLTTGAGPGLYTNVMATEVYIKGFIDGRLGYSSAVGIVMAAIMTAFGILYLRVIARARTEGGLLMVAAPNRVRMGWRWRSGTSASRSPYRDDAAVSLRPRLPDRVGVRGVIPDA